MSSARPAGLGVGQGAVLVGALLFGTAMLIAAIGLLYTPWEPNQMDLLHRDSGPLPGHPLGTDQFGRDVLSRVMAGGVYSLALGIGGPLIALALALPIALAVALQGGGTEQAIMRLNDALLAIPTLMFALLVIVGLGPGVFNTVIAIGIAIAPKLLRVIHAAAIGVVREDYVVAARVRGEARLFMMFREMLPNLWAPVFVETSIYAGFGITAGAALSYLGLGTQPPAADWGVMIRDGWQEIGETPWPLIGAGLPIVASVLGFNLFGDGLRDRLLGESTHG